VPKLQPKSRKDLKGRPVPEPRPPTSPTATARPQPGQTRKPASTQDAQDQRHPSRRPRIPSSLHTVQRTKFTATRPLRRARGGAL
jgi:hypothetical protein